MKGRLIKCLGMVCLSVLFAYSGVAWAFEDCLSESGESTTEQLAIGDSRSHDASVDLVAPSTGEPASQVHCLTIHHEFDAIVQSLLTSSLTQPRKTIQLKSSFSGDGLALAGKNRMGGRSPHLDWFITSSPPGFPSRSRHLLLSIFLI
jgi:hypothetical protein